MRILSQDGRIDLPYENFSLSITQDNCIVAARDVVARPTEMLIGTVAKYSSFEKAQKAMEMLHIAYAGKFITNADVSDDFNEQLKEMMKGGFGAVIVKDIGDCRMEFNNLNGYFKFPSEEELEV